MPESPELSIEAVAARQHGVFTRAQARAEDVTDRVLHRWVVEGRWVRCLPTTYRVAAVPRTFRQRAMATALWSDGLVSHESAGRLRRYPRIASATIHVTTDRTRGLRHDDITVHRVDGLIPADRGKVEGIACTSALRTALDLAASLVPDHFELVVEDGLRRRLFSLGQLRWRAELLTGPGVAGSAAIQQLLARRLGGSDSDWEVVVEQILRAAGLPAPTRQLRVDTIEGVRFVDLGYPGPPVVALEYDSDRWHSSVRQRHRDAARRNLLRLAGCTVVEITPSLVADPPALIAAVRAALGAVVYRCGT